MFQAAMAETVRFGGFEFDARTRELRRRGIRLRVPDQSLEILALLLRHPGEVVTREEIQARLWPNGTIVDFEHSVNSAVQRLREALSDSAARPRYIKTVAKRGYQFIGAVEAPAPAIPHFRIVEEIGRGAMGIVYRAEDLWLGRHVALKVLPPELASDPEGKARLIREARAASALNHPNIIGIHEVGSEKGVDFIAMEYVEGKTLGELIPKKGLALQKALDYAIQIAAGLAKAHTAGIVHRDLKPGNVMVTPEGLVKLLDFGLARRVQAEQQESTHDGSIAGTPAYMSPEQAEGKKVDARSDIFSFGSLLYEMTTGRRAFSRETHASTLAAILREEPTPVTQVARGTPRDLDRVISRCLRKDPERRFQQMADLRVALEELKEESGSGPLAPARPRTHRPRSLTWAAGAFLLVAALGLGAWFGLVRRPPAAPAPKVRTFAGLPGTEARPAFSPDGKQLAFAWNGDQQDNFDIYIQRVDGATPRRLTFDPAQDYGPVWSPDGLDVAFLRDTPAGTEVIRIPAAGNVEQKLHVSPVRISSSWPFCGLAWSPNGQFLAIVDEGPTQASSSIFLLDLKTREKQELTNTPADSWDGLPAFSPDGSSLAFIRGHDRPLSDIYVLRLSDSGQPRGEPRRITGDNTYVYGLDWTANGRSIVFSSTRGGVWALWQVSASGGEPERLRVSGNHAFWPAISRTGNRLAYQEGGDDWNIWRVAAPGGGATAGPAAAPLQFSPSPAIDQEPAFSPDGRTIAWASTRSGSHQIWLSNSDGSQPHQLTDHEPPGAAEPRWSSDGKQIAFNGYSRGTRKVNVIRVEGGTPRRLTSGNFAEDVFDWSRDGRWVYFGSDRGDGYALWKAPAGGGSPVLVAPHGWAPVESLDGRFVYYGGSEGSVWKRPVSGGSPVRVARNGWGPVESFDGKFVYYNGPEDSVWRVPATGGEPALVMKKGPKASWTLASAGIYILEPDAKGGPSIELFSFAGRRTAALRLPAGPGSYLPWPVSVSPDGRWIFYMRADPAEADIMLVENFR